MTTLCVCAVPDAVDHTVGRHAIGAIVNDGVCTQEGVEAVLRARVRFFSQPFDVLALTSAVPASRRGCGGVHWVAVAASGRMR